MKEKQKCKLCGEPMPDGEEMFKFHGYSGDCPAPPLPKTLYGGAGFAGESLLQAIKSVIYERGENMPLPLVIGVLRILEHEIIKEQE